MKASPRLDGKPFIIRVYLKRMKVSERKALAIWLKENMVGRYCLFDRAKFLETVELYLANLNDAIIIRMAQPELYSGSSDYVPL